MPFIELGKSALGGGEEAAFSPQPAASPKKVLVADAVRAAVQVMNRMDNTPTGVMGVDSPEILRNNFQQTNTLLCTAARVARENPAAVGAPRLIRLGLLTDEWMMFRERMCALAQVAEGMVQELSAYRQRAYAMAEEVANASKHGSSTTPRNPYGLGAFPWKPLLFGVGIITIGTVGWRLWRSRQAPKSSQYEE